MFRFLRTGKKFAVVRCGRSGDGSRVYAALENDVEAAVIDTLTNRVIANVPIGQTSQALVYMPNAVPAGDGTDNLVPFLARQRRKREYSWRFGRWHC
jgi:YVTN family beta-propeller protein